MKKYIILLSIVSTCFSNYAQIIGEANVLDVDAFYLHYTLPTSLSDDISYQKWSARLGMSPIRYKNLMLVNGFGFDLHQFSYDESNIPTLDNFYNINYSLIGIYKLSDLWKINGIISPMLLSNLKGDLNTDDFLLNVKLLAERTFLRKKGGYFQFAFGLGYLTLNGDTQISPIISLKARLNEKYSFVLGIPNMYFKYDINKIHSLKALLDLNDFSGDINSVKNTTGTYSKAVFTTVSLGLEYNYWLKKSFGIMLRATQSIYHSYELRDDNNSYDFDSNPKQAFITIGIKYNPIKSLQDRLKPLF